MTREELIKCAKRRETLMWAGDEYLLLRSAERLYSMRRVRDGFLIVTDFTDNEMWSRSVQPKPNRFTACYSCGCEVAGHLGDHCPWCHPRKTTSAYALPVDPYVEHREKNRDIEAMTFKCAVADGITGVQHTCASCATPIPDEAFEPALGYVVKVTSCRVCGEER